MFQGEDQCGVGLEIWLELAANWESDRHGSVQRFIEVGMM